MKLFRAAEVLVATLAGFVGAATAILLFHGTPLSAATPPALPVVKAYEFLLLNAKNETVGRLATSTRDGLPFMALEGVERDGIPFKDGAILIGFHERVPQVRVHGADRKGGSVIAVIDGDGKLSLMSERGVENITFESSQGKVWKQILEDRKP